MIFGINQKMADDTLSKQAWVIWIQVYLRNFFSIYVQARQTLPGADPNPVVMILCQGKNQVALNGICRISWIFFVKFCNAICIDGNAAVLIYKQFIAF